MLASDLYAKSQNSQNEGDQVCHWCLAACNRSTVHDDPLPIPFSRGRSTAKKPDSLWVCNGCKLYRRPRVTVPFLTKGFKDSQCAKHHSWWIEETGAWTIQETDYQAVYDKLLKPPTRFVLSFLVSDNVDNHLHLSILNDHAKIDIDTPLFFTINNVKHSYCIYDLETCLKQREASREPGVRALMDLLGPCLTVKSEDKKIAGKPTNQAKPGITVKPPNR